MTTPNLMNLPDAQKDPTLKYFNNYFSPAFDIGQNVNDAIIGYFENLTINKQAAKMLAGSMVFTCKVQGLDPMTILYDFSQLPPGQINAYLTMFLNLNRINTSMLGISNAPTTSKYIARTILP